ncbi:DHA2 family efflux MFS transporter permease subunit [Inquilinus sp. CAU 1745]|uniref:DHA2 family efflux MFS transporter permease subunit n=1 Tax=Inquilinus sp. CAU 1745 TaxID=3140369 RepID=UPI00325B517E
MIRVTGDDDRVSGAAIWLLLGVTAVACLDAINGTALAIARADIMGSIHTTPDEAAWLNMAYLMAKLTAFPIGAWLGLRIDRGQCLVGSTVVIILSSLAGGLTTEFYQLVIWRALQGVSGAVLLVVGQTVLFEFLPRGRQPLVQAAFALAVVAMPTAIAPAAQGWLTETLSWSWIFLLNLPGGLIGLAMILAGLGAIPVVQRATIRLDWVGLMLFAVAMVCLVYVLQQGNRWNWFAESRIVNLSIVGMIAVLAFAAWEIRSQGRDPLIDLATFHDPNFAFGFIVSFVAGCALFGSAFLIPLFALSVLGFSETYAGLLLLPSGALTGLGLFAAAALIQVRRLSPIKLVPVGIVLFMSAMWLLSGSTSESGIPDMTTALLLRGFGLGPLFVALTLITFLGLGGPRLAHGVALFNFGRQFGGLIGVAFLQTYLAHQAALNRSVLATHFTPGSPALEARQNAITDLLATQGYSSEMAAAVTAMIQRSLQTQIMTLSFNEGFLVLALLFVSAAPMLIAVKIILAMTAGRKAVDERATE